MTGNLSRRQLRQDSKGFYDRLLQLELIGGDVNQIYLHTTDAIAATSFSSCAIRIHTHELKRLGVDRAYVAAGDLHTGCHRTQGLDIRAFRTDVEIYAAWNVKPGTRRNKTTCADLAPINWVMYANTTATTFTNSRICASAL